MEKPFTIFVYDPEVFQFTPAQEFLIKQIGTYVAQLIDLEKVRVQFPDGLIDLSKKSDDQYDFDDDGNLIRLRMKLDIRFSFKAESPQPELPDENKLF